MISAFLGIRPTIQAKRCGLLIPVPPSSQRWELNALPLALRPIIHVSLVDISCRVLSCCTPRLPQNLLPIAVVASCSVRCGVAGVGVSLGSLALASRRCVDWLTSLVQCAVRIGCRSGVSSFFSAVGIDENERLPLAFFARFV